MPNAKMIQEISKVVIANRKTGKEKDCTKIFNEWNADFCRESLDLKTVSFLLTLIDDMLKMDIMLLENAAAFA